MIKETYISAQKRVVPHGEIVLDISRFRKRESHVSPLAPSRELLDDWDQGKIVWKKYVERYYQELKENEEATALIVDIADLSARKNVWLVCTEREYPCHRFLVKQVIERILVARNVLKEPEDYVDSYRRCKNLTRSEIEERRKPETRSKPDRGRNRQPLVPVLPPEGDE